MILLQKLQEKAGQKDSKPASYLKKALIADIFNKISDLNDCDYDEEHLKKEKESDMLMYFSVMEELIIGGSDDYQIAINTHFQFILDFYEDQNLELPKKVSTVLVLDPKNFHENILKLTNQFYNNLISHVFVKI